LSYRLIYLIEDLDLTFAFAELVYEVIELTLDTCRNSHDADPGTVLLPFIFFHSACRRNITVCAGCVVGRDPDGKPEFLESYGKDRTQRFYNLFNLFIDMFEWIDVDPGFFHSHF